MEAGYSDDFGPPSWVSGPLPSATLAHMVRTQPTPEECQEAEDLADLVANLDLPSVETLEDRGALTLTIASLSAFPPAEHLEA